MPYINNKSQTYDSCLDKSSSSLLSYYLVLFYLNLFIVRKEKKKAYWCIARVARG